MFRRLFVANRGEVAARIIRACDQLGITPVIGVSEVDRAAPYTEGRETICLGPATAQDSYLHLAKVTQAALQSECTALHPGWGFLAENHRFASLVGAHGITFIGPRPETMRLMGQKTPAKTAMKNAGLACIPGSDGILASVDEARDVARDVGYPVLLKAESGGGGRGMRVAHTEAELETAYRDAQNEARGAFGDERLYLEKLIEQGRHIEIQLMADNYGNVVHLGERDCTIQRKHQKLIEESPSPSLSKEEHKRTCSAAVVAAQAINYVGAGTMEFLLTDDGILRFMEMNTRLQVEHSVTEMRSGVDLVAAQLRVAAGHPLPWAQSDIHAKGHVIECRINAEDPRDGFRPCPGTITEWRPPAQSESIRVDTHVAAGYTVSPHYDSLLCKLIAHGKDREAATKTMLQALAEFTCTGVATTIPMHQAILSSAEFQNNTYDTRRMPGWSA